MPIQNLTQVSFFAGVDLKERFAAKAKTFDCTLAAAMKGLMYRFTQMSDEEINQLFDEAVAAGELKRIAS